jgi:hypothetical protein
MFKTARFKVHNPSRHKSVMLWYAMTHYHLTLKAAIERVLAIPDLVERVSQPDKRNKLRPNRFAVAKVIRENTPLNWELAPLRDYLIGDASAMIMSHLSKVYKPTANSPIQKRSSPSSPNSRRKSPAQPQAAERGSRRGSRRFTRTGPSPAPPGNCYGSSMASCLAQSNSRTQSSLAGAC